MRRALVIAAGLLLWSNAAAERLRIGASLGRTDGDGLGDAARTHSLFARVRLSERLGAELAAGRMIPDTDSYRTDLLSAALTVDLGVRDRLTPYLIAGLGVARTTSTWWEGEHRTAEVGIGLDYAVGSGVTVGVEARYGERVLIGERAPGDVILDLYAPPVLDEGDYTRARITLSVAL